jgi:hypothetical protein
MRAVRNLSLAAIICAICVGSVSNAWAARFVPAEVLLDGKVILEGNASDNGHRDADELWEALKTVQFKPTEEFWKLNIDNEAARAVVESTAPKGQQVNLKIEVTYGGMALTRKIRVYRVPPDSAGRDWRIDAVDIEDLFDSRMISRRDAAGLVNPKRKK